MFTTLTNWLRPDSRKPRRHTRGLGAPLESLEDRVVLDATNFSLFNNAGTYAQDWSADFSSWSDSAVTGIEGFDGKALAAAGTNPGTITGTVTSTTLTPNLTDPAATNPGGIAEFQIGADRVVAIAGGTTPATPNSTGINAAPYLLMHLDTRNTGDVSVSYNLRDMDDSSRGVVSQVALQYRVSPNGDFTGIPFVNVANAYVADASNTGTNTKVTPVSVTLPGAVNNQEFVQLRIITVDGLSANSGQPNTLDEWIGVDDIFVHGNLQPVVSLNTTQLDYIENSPLTFIDPVMGLSDIDSNDFQGGKLVVNYAAVPTADDRLIVNNQGTGVGQISWTGTVATGLSIQYTTVSGTATIGTVNPNGGVPLPSSPSGALIINFTSAAATPTAVRALLRNIGYLNVSDDPVGGIRNVQFTISDGDSSTGQTSATVSRAVNVIPVNDSPVVTLPGGNRTIQEGAAPIIIDPTASIVDPDSHDYDGGTLVVSFPGIGPAAPTIFDHITIQDQGTGVGQISVNLLTSEVSYTGVGGTVVIGTFTGGLNGAPLVVTFNASSNPTPETIQAVIRAIQYQNTSDNPPANPRPIRFVAFDNDADAFGTGVSANVQVTVTIQPLNDEPVITPSRAGFTYTENDAPTAIDAAMTFVDPDSFDFSSGTLVADYTAGGSADDRLTVRNQGTGVGQVSVGVPTATTVSYNFGTGPVPIGTITSSGVGTTRLQITFNPSATQPAVLAVLQNISFSNASDNPSTAPRTVRIVLSDGDGGFSPAVTWSISVNSVNDGPTIGNVPGTLVPSYEAGFPAVVLAPVATVVDPDSPNFSTGNFTVTSTGGLAADVIGIRNQGSGAGRIGLVGTNVTYSGVTIGSFSGGTAGVPLVVSLNASATPAAVQALAAAITFRTPNGLGVTGIRSLAFSALDFAGGTPSNIRTIDVNVVSSAGPNDDFYETNEDFTLTVSAGLGVLTNDTNGTLAAVTQQPVKGTVNLAPDGAFQYVPAPDANGTDTFKYEWTNSSTSTVSVATVTIVINAVNDAPIATFTPTLVTVNEDSGPYPPTAFATFGPGPATALDEASQTLTRSITNNNNGLFSSQPAIDASGKLTFTPAPNANGTAIVTVNLQDSGGTFGNILDQDTAQYTFTIVVNAVNDIPTFQTASAQVTAPEDAGPQTVSGFASNFRPGPATATDEAVQTPTYILTPIGTSGGLTFTVDPAINAAGDLTFTAAPDSNGTASFIVAVRDSGDTANGGVNISAPRTLTIIIGAVDDPPTAGDDTATVIWNSDPNPIAVLANDSGAPDAGDTVTVSAVTQPANGTVAILPGGTGVTYQPNRGYVSPVNPDVPDVFTYTASDGQGNLTVATVSVKVIRYQTQPVDLVALGSGVNGDSRIRIYNSKTGQFVGGFSAYPDFQGGVSVATADVNGDGVTDIIVGAGSGGGPHIQIVDGTRIGLLQGLDQIAPPTALLGNFFGYAFDFRGGVTVASGDVNGDGKSDIILGTGPGGAAHVKIISGAKINEIGSDLQPKPSAILASYFAYDPNFRGGVLVATGDVNSDGYFDVLAAAGPGGASHVKAFSGRKLFESGPDAPGVLLASFYGFDPNFRGGATVAAGDFNNDGYDDFIVGAGPGGGSHVKVFSPFNLATPIASFFAFEPGFNGGVNVGYRLRSGGSTPLLLAGSGAGAQSRLATFAPPNFTTAGTVDVFDNSFMGGVDVG